MAIFANESSGYVQQDVAARLDYGEDWSAFMALVPGDFIVDQSWASFPSGLVFQDNVVDDNVAVVFISGGVPGTVYRVQNRIETDGGRVDVRSFYLSIVDGGAAQPVPLVSALFDRFDSIREFKASSLAFLDDSFPVDGLTDDVIWDNLLAAEAEAAHQLRVFLQPTTIIPDSAKPEELAALTAAGTPFVQEDDYDFDPLHWNASEWGFLPLRKAPVVAITSVQVSYPSPGNVIMTVPPEWLQLDHKYGQLRFVPAGAMMTLGPLSSFVMSTMAAGRNLPGALQIRYVAGLKDAKRDYPDLVNLVKRMAVLRILKNAMIPNSASISADGLSESQSFDLDKMQGGIDKDLGDLRDQIKGIRLGVL